VLSQARKIHKYDAEDVCELLNSRHLELKLDDAVEFLKRSALERSEDPDPKHGEKTVTVSMLTGGLEITEAGNERTATTRRGIIRMPTVTRIRRRAGFFLASRQCFISSGHSQGLVHRHLYFSRRSFSCLNRYLFARIHIYFTIL
jgi:hypothetical protein